jgi:ABC-type nitrate/sulfonate/bicarbonate transport system substrate-binding protein
MDSLRIAQRLACVLLVGLVLACGGAASNTALAKPPAVTPAGSAPAASTAVSAPPATAPAPPAASGRPITIAWTAAAFDYGPLWIAADKGFFAAHGVNVQLVFIEVSASFQALVARDIDVLATASDPNLRAQGVDVKYFGTPMHALNQGLYGRQGLETTPAALVGKTVAATSSGSATDIFAREALGRLGVDPATMRFLYTQNIPSIYAGLDSGQIDIGPLGPPFAFRAEDSPAFVKLAPLGTIRVPFMVAAPLAHADWIRAHEAEAMGILRGYQDAILFARGNEQETKAIAGKYLNLDDEQVLKRSYDRAMEFWGVPDLAVDRDALKIAIEYGARVNPAVQGLTVEEFIYDDNRLANALR